MGMEYYMFALFIAGLICLIAILCKMLFADLRRQHKLLDEKETKLLQLYQTIESIMEEFADQAKATTLEIKEFESRFPRQPSPAPPPQKPGKTGTIEKLQRSVTVDSSRIRAASQVLERAERIIKSDAPKVQAHTGSSNNAVVFQRFFDETASEPVEPEVGLSAKQSREKAILELASEGKTEAQIASELGITRNEVKLVIGLKKK